MNRLAAETSPYLIQHAENPVDWYPWCDEAFERARSEDKPVLLSVGYSSCHWCHVMAHESFEDDETAEVMNEGFVSVKVDREERPDVDALYMEATMALTGRGGWPMTVFLTPEGRPFFAGTYFPKRAHGGLPSFRELLDAVSEAWRDRREEVDGQANKLTDAISRAMGGTDRHSPEAGGETPSGASAHAEVARGVPGDIAELAADASTALRRWMLRAWDPGWGGFGTAPKFPQAALIEMALRWAHSDPSDDEALAIATTTLAGMASGGVYDHLGGGFARYSTDERWMVPHFEKMLYDQASLLRAYLHGWQVTGDERWLQIAGETADYVLRDLALPAGGLASAEDADSPGWERRDGGEGAFYLWRALEIKEALPEELADALMDFYSVTWKGNLSGRLEGGEGLSVLRRPPGAPLGRPQIVEEARRLLLETREGRPRPGLDTKVLTEWNAMFLSSLAEAAAATGNSRWAASATELGEFLYESSRSPDGRWLRLPGSSGTLLAAYAADYAWVVESFTRLAELTGASAWIHRATEAAEALVSLFSDEESGAFYTAGSDAERLVVRVRESTDGSTPSATSVAAMALWRLGSLTGRNDFVERARSALGSLSRQMGSQPAASAFAIAVAELLAEGATEIVVTGERPDLVEVAQRSYLPAAVLAWGEPYPGPLWEGRDARGLAYVCRDFTCAAPTADAAELANLLRP